jgi:hypothetical protein
MNSNNNGLQEGLDGGKGKIANHPNRPTKTTANKSPSVPYGATTSVHTEIIQTSVLELPVLKRVCDPLIKQFKEEYSQIST